MKAVEFDKWFKAEMPNSHKKVNKERIETIIYSCAEAAWDYQQAKIDDSENTRAVLYRENMDIREKNTDLQAEIDLLEVQLKGAEERAKLTLDHKNRIADELQKENDRLNTWYKNVKLQLENKQIDCDRSDRKIDELQARFDEITNHVGINFDEERDDDQHSYWSGYNQAMRELNDILKGNKDD